MVNIAIGIFWRIRKGCSREKEVKATKPAQFYQLFLFTSCFLHSVFLARSKAPRTTALPDNIFSLIPDIED